MKYQIFRVHRGGKIQIFLVGGNQGISAAAAETAFPFRRIAVFDHEPLLIAQPEIHPARIVPQMDADGMFRVDQLSGIGAGLQYFQSIQLVLSEKMLQILPALKPIQILRAGGDIHNMPHGIPFFLRPLYL